MTELPNDVFLSSAETSCRFQKGEILFLEGEPCLRIGYVGEGRIVIRSATSEGSEYLIQEVTQGHFFGDVMMFADEHRYLGNVVAETDVVVGFYSVPIFLRMLSRDKGSLERYLRGLALKAFELKQDVKMLAMPTLRERILFYLDSLERNDDSGWIGIPISREKLAAKLGVCRPSLSRELFRMSREGIIRIEGRKISRIPKKQGHLVKG